MATAVDNIFDFKAGAVILDRKYLTKDGKTVDMYGHVTGFGLNCFQEVVLDVRWADGEASLIHPALVHLEGAS